VLGKIGNLELRFGTTPGYATSVRTTVSIPDRIFRAAERAAKRQRVSPSRFYAQAIEAYLKAVSGKSITEALNAVYATEDSSLDPVIARLQSLALGREEW
jgi:metal-responsive CopG/Arc/MetJ family transcriptional regulator